MYSWDLNNDFYMKKKFPFALLNASWNSCMASFCKTLCPVSSVHLPPMSGTRETYIYQPSCAHNSPAFLLPEAIFVDKRFYRVEQEQIKPTWNQKKRREKKNPKRLREYFSLLW